MNISYKWAGGGLTSNAEDLVKFGNAVLACYQVKSTMASCKDSDASSLLLSPKTVAMMWKPAVKNISPADPLLAYGMGWYIREEDPGLLCGKRKPFFVGHTGSTVGASSVMVIIPTVSQVVEVPEKTAPDSVLPQQQNAIPSGVTVAIIFNLQEVRGLYFLGFQVAQKFL